MRSGVTAMQWNTIHESKHWNADTQAIVSQSISNRKQHITHKKRKNPERQQQFIVITVSTLQQYSEQFKL